MKLKCSKFSESQNHLKCGEIWSVLQYVTASGDSCVQQSGGQRHQLSVQHSRCWWQSQVDSAVFRPSCSLLAGMSPGSNEHTAQSPSEPCLLVYTTHAAVQWQSGPVLRGLIGIGRDGKRRGGGKREKRNGWRRERWTREWEGRDGTGREWEERDYSPQTSIPGAANGDNHTQQLQTFLTDT